MLHYTKVRSPTSRLHTIQKSKKTTTTSLRFTCCTHLHDIIRLKRQHFHRITAPLSLPPPLPPRQSRRSPAITYHTSHSARCLRPRVPASANLRHPARRGSTTRNIFLDPYSKVLLGKIRKKTQKNAKNMQKQNKKKVALFQQKKKQEANHTTSTIGAPRGRNKSYFHTFRPHHPSAKSTK